jgi:hypothetical protein
MTKLRLEPNVIPPENHGKNLRSMLPKDDWDLLRTDCYMRSGYVCEICGGKGKKHPVEAHEEWTYDLKKRIQTLKAILALCPDCHLVKHIGRAILIGKFEKAVKHFAKVNKMKPDTAEMYLSDFMNHRIDLMSISFKINIDVAKKRLIELFDQQEEVLNAFPITKKGEKR